MGKTGEIHPDLLTPPTRITGGGQPLIISLDGLGRGDVALAGGKGANLGELRRGGFPVPAGFVVTTVGYDQFVAHSHLEEAIGQSQGGSGEGGAAIRSAFESAQIPAGLEEAILAAYQQLREPAAVPQGLPPVAPQGLPLVAVRSSATAEDLPQAAFAGQQDTYLNVTGPRDLLDAVRRCWASLWTDRAIAYRRRQGIDPAEVKLAVVVQRMVMAEAAGVLFTANPVTGDRDEIVIDASPGLGEAVVSGLVTPDRAVLRKGRTGWRIVERSLGRREAIIQALPEGGTQKVEGPGAAVQPAIPDRALRRLATLGQEIERHFGLPQDVEWAWAGGEVSILQARPITGLPEPPPSAGKPVQMLAGIFAEMFPVRPYPLDQTTWVPAISEAAVTPIFSIIGLSVPSIDHFFDEEDGVVTRFNGDIPFRLSPGVLLAPARLLWLAARYDPIHFRADPLLVEAREKVRSLEKLDLAELAAGDLLAVVAEALELPLPLAGTVRRRYLPRVLLAAGLLRAVLGLVGRGDQFGALLSGAGSATLDTNHALEALADRVRADPGLAQVFAACEPGQLYDALKASSAGQAISWTSWRGSWTRYGHREVAFSSILTPTWKDAPEVVLGMLKGMALSQPEPEPDRPAWMTARDSVLMHPLMRIRPLRSAFLGLLAAARCFWQIREDTHFEATRVLPVLRRTLLEIGERLVGAGALENREEVFHLRWEEVRDACGSWPPSAEAASRIRALVQLRKQRRAALEGTPVIDPRLYRQTGPGPGGEGDVLLHGTPGSPGVAEGRVRLVREAAEFNRLLAGEVLVAPYTNPAWTPLFQRAAAVVVDAGGTGSHAAIVAREYGIPAVMGTVEGTRKLEDGQVVRVDGSRGLVFGKP